MRDSGPKVHYEGPDGKRLPKVSVPRAADTTIQIRSRKIPHREILRALQGFANAPADLAGMYRQKVIPQKTRTIRLLGRKSSAKIIHTLLGYEVQASYKRIQCPDFVTARYLKLFSELGCHSIKLPYDPTITAELIPDLEAVMESIRKGIRELFPKNPGLQHYVLRRVYGIIRKQLRAD